MNFNENDIWRGKTGILNLRLFTLPSAKVLHKLEFDTKDQVLLLFETFPFFFVFYNQNKRFGHFLVENLDTRLNLFFCISSQKKEAAQNCVRSEQFF